MRKKKILNAWRNADAFHDLSAEERAKLPESPAALLATDDVLNSVSGGCGCAVDPGAISTGCCTFCGPFLCN